MFGIRKRVWLAILKFVPEGMIQKARERAFERALSDTENAYVRLIAATKDPWKRLARRRAYEQYAKQIVNAKTLDDIDSATALLKDDFVDTEA